MVWSSTPPGSLRRKLFVHYYIARLTREGVNDYFASLPEDFMQELPLAAFLKVPYVTLAEAGSHFEQFLEPEEPENSAT